MSLLPTGLNNSIIEWKAKTKQVNITVHDASGAIPYLEHFRAAFYAKKFPIKASADMDISIGYAGYDASKGQLIFDLLEPLTNIEPGDYVYEVVLENKYNSLQYTIVQDKLTIVDSLDDNYSNIFFNVHAPLDGYVFTPKILDVSVNVSTPDNVSWNMEYPDWNFVYPFNHRGSYDDILTIIEPDSNQSTGSLTFNYAGGSIVVDVSYFKSDITLTPSEFTFTPYDTSFNLVLDTSDNNYWEIDNIPVWLNVSDTSGYGPANIVVSTDTSLYQTLETVDVSSQYSSLIEELDVSFYYRTILETNPTSFTFTPYDMSTLITLDTSTLNMWWNSLLPSWLSLSKNNGTGPDTFVLSTDTSLYQTLDTVDFKSSYADDWNIDVSFYYRTNVTTNPINITFNPYDSSQYVSIITVDKNPWNIELPNWLSSDVYSGIGDTSILLIADSSKNIEPEDISVNSWYADTLNIDASYYYHTDLEINPLYLLWDSIIERQLDISTNEFNYWNVDLSSNLTSNINNGIGDASIWLTYTGSEPSVNELINLGTIISNFANDISINAIFSPEIDELKWEFEDSLISTFNEYELSGTAPTYITGKVGKAIQNGVYVCDDSIISETFAVGNGWTISFWLYCGGEQSWEVFQLRNGGYLKFDLLGPDDNQFNQLRLNDSIKNLSGYTSAQQWNLIVLSCANTSGTTPFDLYINNVLKYHSDMWPSFGSPTEFHLRPSSDLDLESFDQLRIIDHVVTSEERDYLWNNGNGR